LQKKEYNDDMYSFKLQYNTKVIKCTKEHPFYVRDIIRKSNGCDIGFSDFYWCNANKIIKNKHVMCCPINNQSIIPEFNIEKRINETKTVIINKKLNNLDEYYMMGYYMGDGWLDWNVKSKRNRFYMCIKKHNTNIIETISKVLNYSISKETDKIYQFDFSNKVWYEILKEFGHLAHNKIIPEWIHNAPTEYIKSFISGYADADGCKKYNQYTTVSENIAYGLQRLHAKLGIITSVKFQKRLPATIIEGRVVNQRDTYSINIIINEKRKYISMIDEKFIYFQVKSINIENYNNYVYNFEVADDNSYIVQNAIVHNCHILYQFHVNIETKELSCSFYQRSNDYMLAGVYNICSASILVFMLCHLTGYKPGKIIHNIGNIHIYMNQIEVVKEIIKNKPFNFPLLFIEDPKKEIKTIDDFTYEHFKLIFYNSHKKYNITMSV
jgi:hypothetical protein